MRKYKVLVIAHQLKNQVIAKYGEIIDESQLNGNSADLVKAGFIAQIEFEETEIIDESQLNVKEPVEKVSKKLKKSE